MRKYSCTFVFLILLGMFWPFKQVIAQTARFIPYEKTVKRMLAHKLVSVDNTGIYVYQASRNERIIAKYSFDLMLLTKKTIPLPINGPEIEEVLVDKVETRVFFSMFNNNEARHGLFLLRIPHAGEAIMPPTNLVDQYGVQSKKESIMELLSPKDQSFYAALHIFKSNKEQISCYINYFNHDLSPASKNTFSFPISQVDMVLNQSTLDPQGNIFLLFSCVDLEKNKGEADKYFWRLIKVNKDSGNYAYTDLTLPNYCIKSLQMAWAKDSSCFVFSGLYAKQPENYALGTVFAKYYTDSSTFNNIHLQPFDENLRTQLVGTKRASKVEGLPDYTAKNMVVRTDGGVVLFTEKFYQTTQQFVQYTQGFPITRSVSYYHFDDVLAISINPDGTHDWNQLIQKQQTSSNLGASNSFSIMKTPEQIWCIFHDDMRNNGQVLQYAINPNGVVSSPVGNGAALQGVYIFPLDAKQVTGKTMLIPAVKGRKNGLLKVTY